MSVLDLSRSPAAGRCGPVPGPRELCAAREESFGSSPAWAALRALGTELWLDTGDLEAAASLWTDELSNLTTNNTLVNKEVQKGLFDDVIPRVARALAKRIRAFRMRRWSSRSDLWSTAALRCGSSAPSTRA